jgi:hypothetical protein
MELRRDRPLETRSLLYPLMVIAAIAVITFSVLGVATLMGWMPTALANAQPAADFPGAARTGVTFDCAECGILESLRDTERPDSRSAPREIVAYVQS